MGLWTWLVVGRRLGVRLLTFVLIGGLNGVVGCLALLFAFGGGCLSLDLAGYFAEPVAAVSLHGRVPFKGRCRGGILGGDEIPCLLFRSRHGIVLRLACGLFFSEQLRKG